MAKILVVDDEVDLVDTLVFRLKQIGHDVEKAFDGLEALDVVRKYIPDVIILDVMLPDLDGYRVCREIKKDRSLSSIPIIMVSARSQESDRREGLEAGASEYITKPIEVNYLLGIVDALLGGEK